MYKQAVIAGLLALATPQALHATTIVTFDYDSTKPGDGNDIIGGYGQTPGVSTMGPMGGTIPTSGKQSTGYDWAIDGPLPEIGYVNFDVKFSGAPTGPNANAMSQTLGIGAISLYDVNNNLILSASTFGGSMQLPGSTYVMQPGTTCPGPAGQPGCVGGRVAGLLGNQTVMFQGGQGYFQADNLDINGGYLQDLYDITEGRYANFFSIFNFSPGSYSLANMLGSAVTGGTLGLGFQVNSFYGELNVQSILASEVPEPSTALLMMSGVVAVWRKRKATCEKEL